MDVFAIVHALAALDPYDHHTEVCFFCRTLPGMPHSAECLWLAASQIGEYDHADE